MEGRNFMEIENEKLFSFEHEFWKIDFWFLNFVQISY